MNDADNFIFSDLPPEDDETGGLAEESSLVEAKRNSQLAKHWGERRTTVIGYYAMWAILIVSSFVLISAIIVWGWHNLVNENYHFLTDMQIDKIQTVLFSGAVATLFSNAVRTFSVKYFHN
ncbi:MAG: hypothetical protein K0U39_10115 [Alphaproteobacteria bacterium]|nr:hypothetical protein [Alphaproteobacteria bacterium]